MSTTILITILLYLLGMVVVGFIFSNQNKDSADFYLSGRKLGPLSVLLLPRPISL